MLCTRLQSVSASYISPASAQELSYLKDACHFTLMDGSCVGSIGTGGNPEEGSTPRLRWVLARIHPTRDQPSVLLTDAHLYRWCSRRRGKNYFNLGDGGQLQQRRSDNRPTCRGDRQPRKEASGGIAVQDVSGVRVGKGWYGTDLKSLSFTIQSTREGFGVPGTTAAMRKPSEIKKKVPSPSAHERSDGGHHGPHLSHGVTHYSGAADESARPFGCTPGPFSPSSLCGWHTCRTPTRWPSTA